MSSALDIARSRVRAAAYVSLLLMLTALAAFIFRPSSQIAVHTAAGAAPIPASFFAATEGLRAGRYADAYRMFVVLADRGDVDASRVALFMYRFGPTLYGSAWSASVEQVATWTARSQAAEDKDLAHLRPVEPRRADTQR